MVGDKGGASTVQVFDPARVNFLNFSLSSYTKVLDPFPFHGTAHGPDQEGAEFCARALSLSFIRKFHQGLISRKSVTIY